MDCELCVSQKSLLLFWLFSAEDSDGCQNIVEFDILTLLDSQARGCQFTVRKRRLSASFEGFACLTSFPFTI